MPRFEHDDVVRLEFHISRRARVRYDVDTSLFSLNGNVILANFRAAADMARRMNAARDLIRHPESAVSAGQVNAMGLIDEILHLVVALYRQQRNPKALEGALAWLDERLGADAVDHTLRSFAAEFPPTVVYRDEVDLDTYLGATTGGTPHRQVTLEELLLLWLANANPAFKPFRELFDDNNLVNLTAYRPILASLYEYFQTQPRFGPDNQNLIDMLRAPALASPDSLEGQLRFIRERWAYLIGDYLARLLGGLDLIGEEGRMFATHGPPGSASVIDFRYSDAEPERFSDDKDWMPRVVLLAKNAYVWLDQLSKERRQWISRLDQIPDDVLDSLARRGLTGLWLIGLWERSPASRRIKQWCGNPDAVASAYSVYEYAIANDLGGDAAYANLRDRAAARGIRLASDMVPNHMGIDSRWVIEHPDWFLSLDYPPFPSYSFTSGDVVDDSRVTIQIEDHYYTRSDAAVVFKRTDRWTGNETYIYHGNDGTRMPWNDTAQLNFLRADVREAVIQTILHVARQFPIIRFDAAMTLAKRHCHRLWFPEPGSGADIPSRAGRGMTRAEFDALMPVEFWREVVDRVAVEAPETLLLAEAFWMMEGYFVRTLGMHRVYNSAFMIMLRDEDNGKYRAVMKNTLEFDPEIMRRYVNFMSNPDERTAVDQFGKDDKYFGVCTLMVTMPGLPMFSHGQIEGLTEQYGMEYKRAYWDESADTNLVDRHEREIFPLLHRRALFAGIENFRLYDFFTPEGHVNEDVFAYSNRRGGERGLVIYHNRFAEARGWIRTTVGYASKGGDEKRVVQSTLAEGLGLHADPALYCVLRDTVSGLEYLRNSQDLVERGMYVELGAYKYHVFVDIREVRDSAEMPYARVAARLGGAGIYNVDDAVVEEALRPVLTPFREVVNPEVFRRLLRKRTVARAGEDTAAVLADVDDKIERLCRDIRAHIGGTGNTADVARGIQRDVRKVLQLPTLIPMDSTANLPEYNAALDYLAKPAAAAPGRQCVLLGWALTRGLGRLATERLATETSRAWIAEWRLGRVVDRTLDELGLRSSQLGDTSQVLPLLAAYQNWWAAAGRGEKPGVRALTTWLSDPAVQRYLGVNRFEGVLWFNREAFDRWLWWMLALKVLDEIDSPQSTTERAEDVAMWYETIDRLGKAAAASGYRVDRLLRLTDR